MNLELGTACYSAYLEYPGVVVIGIKSMGIRSLVVGFQPRGTSSALLSTGLAQALVAVMAMIAREKNLDYASLLASTRQPHWQSQ
jgi:hypothetical protein